MYQIIKVNEDVYQVKVNNKLEMVVKASNENEAIKQAQKMMKRIINQKGIK